MGATCNIPEKIDPFKTLNITSTTPSNIVKDSYRKLVTSSNKKRKILASISYDILCNKYRYIQKNNLYEAKKKDHFYYVIVGDLENLKSLYEQDNNIILDKDEKNRNLLYLAAKSGFYEICEFLLEKGMDPNDTQINESTPLHAAAFYDHFNVVKLLLEYGAKTKIKNEYDHTPFDEGYSQKIKETILNNDKNIINKFFLDLEEKKLAKKLILVKYNNHIIGKKILRSEEKLPPNIKDILQNWEVGWHGTKYEFLESIMKYGLLPSGTILENGTEIKPLEGHVQYGCKIDDIEDWAKAIFVSPSIFYAGHPVYAQKIFDNSGTEYCVIVETRIKQGTYKEFPPTIVEKLPQTNGEPTFVEYRIEVKDDSNLIIRSEKQENVVVYSILFAKSDFLKNIKDYYKGTIYVNSEEEKNLFLT